MSDTSYILAALAISGVITPALRALPFAALAPLRRSELVRRRLALWMPPGILVILAATTFRSTIEQHLSRREFGYALAGAAITVAVHLLGGRRTLLSVGLGTATYVVLLNAT